VLFILLDSNDVRVAVVVIAHPLECGAELRRTKATFYKKYSSNTVASISWKGWEVDDLSKCED
jgi:hypothetical protein